MLYGHVLNCARSFLDAITYYMKAYRLAPKDPLINLSLGIVHIQRAMQRKALNRHEHLSCGIAFLLQYQEIVGENQETNYNLGRAFHHVGMFLNYLTLRLDTSRGSIL